MSKSGKYKKLLINAVDLAKKFGFNITLDDIVACYSEHQRYWHTLNHLYDILNGVDELYKDKKIDDREFNILVIATIFHDIIYDPKKSDNEEKSIEYMMNKLNTDLSWRQYEYIKRITNIIINTKKHESKDGLCKKFNKLDTWILDAQFIDMLDWENKIYKEYKWVGWKTYKKKRIEFLLKSIKDHTHNVINIKNLIDYISNKIPKVGICYHEMDKLPTIEDYKNDINKNSNLFDNIVIIIVYNTDNYSKELIKEYGVNSNNNEFHALKEVDVIGYLSHHNSNVTIIKGIEYMDQYNKDIERHINKNFNFRTIYI